VPARGRPPPEAMNAPPARRAVILHGELAADAAADDRDVLEQAAAVAHALERLGYRCQTLPLGLDMQRAAGQLALLAPEVVVNLVEGIGGDGRLIHLGPSLLDTLGLAYTGCCTEAMFATSNKLMAKRLLAAADLPTPRWLEARDRFRAPPREADARHIVKSVWEHASIGIDGSSIVAGRDVAATAARRTAELGGEWFAERYVDGREFNLSVLAGPAGPQVLPPAEIDFVGYGAERARIVDWRAKWDPQSYEFSHTPRRFAFPAADAGLLAELQRLALDCWRLFRLNGYARVDFRVDGAGRPWVLEVNANPCLSPDAGFQAAAAEAGLDFVAVMQRILADRVQPRAPRRTAPAPDAPAGAPVPVA